MYIKRVDLVERVNLNISGGSKLIITPEACEMLRGLLSVTPKRLSDMTTLKMNKIKGYEEGRSPLSVRDKNYLQSYFELAGAEIFMGQNMLNVRLHDKDVIVMGQRSERLEGLFNGDTAREIRKFDLGLSQKHAAGVAGPARGRIRAIETVCKTNYSLAHQVALKEAYHAYAQENDLEIGAYRRETLAEKNYNPADDYDDDLDWEP